MKVFIETNEKLISTALLILRISLGVFLFAHGSQKVLGIFGGKGLTATVTMLGKGTGIPDWLLYISAFAEFLGGIGMVLGLLTRFWGIALTINMIVATIVMSPHGFFAPMGIELPAAYAVLAIGITLAGPGLYSLDYVLFAKNTRIPAISREQTFPVPGGSAAFRA